MRTRLFALPWPPRSSVLGVSCFNQLDHVETMARMYRIIVSLSIKRFWGKGERWKRKKERAEGEKRLTQMLLLEPSTPTQHDSIPSNQNHFRSLGCQLHVSKSSPKINLTLRFDRGPVFVLHFATISLFFKPPMRSFRIVVI